MAKLYRGRNFPDESLFFQEIKRLNDEIVHHLSNYLHQKNVYPY